MEFWANVLGCISKVIFSFFRLKSACQKYFCGRLHFTPVILHSCSVYFFLISTENMLPIAKNCVSTFCWALHQNRLGILSCVDCRKVHCIANGRRKAEIGTSHLEITS